MANRSAPSYTLSVPGFTRAVKVLIILTTAVYVFQYLSPTLNATLEAWFALFPGLVAQGQLWRPVTYLFLHASLSHLFWNMFALWMFGVWVEEALGSTRFYQLYFVCGVGGGLVDTGVHLWLHSPASYTIGASGAIYGILLAVGVMFPDRPIFLLLPPVTVKAKWLVLGYGALEFLFTLRSFGGDGGGDDVSHVAHLGGMLFAFLFLKVHLPTFRLFDGYDRWRRRRMQRRFQVYMNKRDRHTPGPNDWMH